MCLTAPPISTNKEKTPRLLAIEPDEAPKHYKNSKENLIWVFIEDHGLYCEMKNFSFIKLHRFKALSSPKATTTIAEMNSRLLKKLNAKAGTAKCTRYGLHQGSIYLN